MSNPAQELNATACWLEDLNSSISGESRAFPQELGSCCSIGLQRGFWRKGLCLSCFKLLCCEGPCAPGWEEPGQKAQILLAATVRERRGLRTPMEASLWGGVEVNGAPSAAPGAAGMSCEAAFVVLWGFPSSYNSKNKCPAQS